MLTWFSVSDKSLAVHELQADEHMDNRLGFYPARHVMSNQRFNVEYPRTSNNNELIEQKSYVSSGEVNASPRLFIFAKSIKAFTSLCDHENTAKQKTIYVPSCFPIGYTLFPSICGSSCLWNHWMPPKKFQTEMGAGI